MSRLPRSSFRLFFLLLICALMSPAVSAAITEVLDYQGYLTTPAGAPVNGVQTLRVALYTQATGGIAAWTQTTGTTVIDGRFSLLLDGRSTSGNAFPAGAFEQSLWAGIKIGSDAEMSPRTLLSAVPYSFKAANADTLNGLTATQLTAAAIAPAIYLGASTNNVGGAAGAIAMNGACHSTYAGSRMCTSAEILAHEGPLTITKAQHVQPVVMSTIGTVSSTAVVVDYSGAKAPWNLMLCGSVSGTSQLPWASSGAGVTGLGLLPGISRLSFVDCGDQDSAAVACCKTP